MSSQITQSFPAALDDEVSNVERVILAQVAVQAVGPNDPKVSQLRALKELREKYYSGTLAEIDRAFATLKKPLQGTLLEHHFTPAAQIGVSQHTFLHGRGRKQSPERQRALAAARMYLIDKTSPTKTLEIYDHLLSQGLTIGGTDPVNNLSAALSHAAGFRSHGKAGWTLGSKESDQ